LSRLLFTVELRVSLFFCRWNVVLNGPNEKTVDFDKDVTEGTLGVKGLDLSCPYARRVPLKGF
jgi:hypothetical protein